MYPSEQMAHQKSDRLYHLTTEMSTLKREKCHESEVCTAFNVAAATAMLSELITMSLLSYHIWNIYENYICCVGPNRRNAAYSKV